MTRDLSRLLRPRSIAVIGGGAWCASIIGAARRIGFEGEIFPVHPAGKEIAGQRAFRTLPECPGPIDAAFVGVNRHATLEVLSDLRGLGAGGAICFASGFSEARAEDDSAADLQAMLVDAAGEMPVLGPNCYGFVNALDRAAVWPDQHGMAPVERGVAILTQSSNIAINLTMQQRGLPIGYVVTCGNMAQTSQAEIALALLEDDRVTALGLHIEGFGDLRAWERLAEAAEARGIPVVALKIGASEQARAAAVSHTASLAGGAAGARALLQRLGFAEVASLPVFLETLKLAHCAGRLSSSRIASISCSGGEASLVADTALRLGLDMPPLSDKQRDGLRAALGPQVALANPLDYHTYIWRDVERMTAAWSAMAEHSGGMTISVVDYPHTDAADWACATEAALQTRARTGARFAVVASLPELMPPDVAARLMAGGVVPICGLDEALAAIAALGNLPKRSNLPLLLPGAGGGHVLDEATAKAALANAGVAIPRGGVADDAEAAARIGRDLKPPLVLKGLGFAHKTEAGAVRLGLTPDALAEAARDMAADRFLVEEMQQGAVAELLVGVLRDPAHGFVLTLGAGGVLTEILRDTVSVLLPAPRDELANALRSLRCWPLLAGYRGKPGADVDAILDTLGQVAGYVTAHAATLEELEINPLLCTPRGAVAVDALIRKGD